jgi:hypothetical protein
VPKALDRTYGSDCFARASGPANSPFPKTPRGMTGSGKFPRQKRV